MASREWLIEHRELQYLRAAAACRPRRRHKYAATQRQRKYAAMRWKKWREVSHLRQINGRD